MKSPIYVEYYSHEGCDCFKIDKPYPEKFGKETIVLCPVQDGIEAAREIADGILQANVNQALDLPVTVLKVGDIEMEWKHDKET